MSKLPLSGSASRLWLALAVSACACRLLAAAGAEKLLWKEPKDRGRADAVRVKLLEALESLSR